MQRSEKPGGAAEKRKKISELLKDRVMKFNAKGSSSSSGEKVKEKNRWKKRTGAKASYTRFIGTIGPNVDKSSGGRIFL